jgi:hypothetical protein
LANRPAAEFGCNSRKVFEKGSREVLMELNFVAASRSLNRGSGRIFPAEQSEQGTNTGDPVE